MLHLFTSDGKLERSYSLPNADPLWCEGAKLYLFGYGNVGTIPIASAIEHSFTSDDVPTGNVVDFSQGLDRAVLTREGRYGSSGGIESVRTAP